MKSFKYFLIGIALCGSHNHAKAVDVQAGPIWNNEHAKEICPKVCSDQKLVWNGNWLTTVPGRMSVCGCNSK